VDGRGISHDCGVLFRLFVVLKLVGRSVGQRHHRFDDSGEDDVLSCGVVDGRMGVAVLTFVRSW
jgi:hypothetical protein